jgi:hypothetical protein
LIVTLLQLSIHNWYIMGWFNWNVQFIGTLLLLHDWGLLHVAWIINFRTLFSEQWSKVQVIKPIDLTVHYWLKYEGLTISRTLYSLSKLASAWIGCKHVEKLQ